MLRGGVFLEESAKRRTTTREPRDNRISNQFGGLREICDYYTMFAAKYSLTSKTLNNISSIEYGRSIIENTIILPAWQKQLVKEARIRSIKSALDLYGADPKTEQIKKYIDGLSKKAGDEVKNYNSCLESVSLFAKTKTIDEEDIKQLHREVSKNILPQSKCGAYRSRKGDFGADPEEILAEMTQLIDWYNGIDGQETHPVLTTGILKACIDLMVPFEQTNLLLSNLATYLSLKLSGYAMNDCICIEEYHSQSRNRYQKVLASAGRTKDMTEWLEYFSDGISYEVSRVQGEILLLARDTKLAKAAGIARLSERQEKIVEFLQDYGILTNKGFSKLFPGVSEDSVLRDLKILVDMGVAVKKGSTKSARYELK